MDKKVKAMQINTNPVFRPNAPEIPGLSFRGFEGQSDYPKMIAVMAGSKEADQIERVDTVDFMVYHYAHLVNFNPYQDMLFAQVDDQVVGYARVNWWQQTDGSRIYRSRCNVLPEWRQKGIGSALLEWGESRLREIAEVHPKDQPGLFQAYAADSEHGAQALLEAHGYVPVRHSYLMVRPDLENIPEAPMPPGLEVRPATVDQVPAIRDASLEAFRDHWGFSEATEPSAQQMVDDPNFDPSLWQVAWDGDQIAGMVLAFINREENQEYRRKRGWTENICVRRPWRKRGLARALIVRSFYAIKERGMQEAALGVDTQNVTGALHLYESVGFRPVKRHTLYRKSMQ